MSEMNPCRYCALVKAQSKGGARADGSPAVSTVDNTGGNVVFGWCPVCSSQGPWASRENVVERWNVANPRPIASGFIAETLAQRDALLAACTHAMAYDAAIQRAASQGKSWVSGDDLDTLYSAWIDASRAAIALCEKGAQP